MGEFLLIILLLFVAYNLAQDVHQRLKVQFVHELARNGGSRWKSVTILYYENAINSDKNDWIFDIEIPKEYFDMSMDDGTNLSKHTDAYIIIANENSNADTAKESIRNLLTLKQAVDSTKTFIIFSRNIYDVLLKITDIDLILIEQKYHWDPNTKTIDKPILEFQRFRSLSTLEPSGMTGVYEGTALKEEQRRILFDRSFSYGNRQVKVTTFPVPPTTIECKQEKDKFCGRDPELVRVIGQVLHFQPVFSRPTLAGSKWGNRLDNGSWTGMIGDVSVGQSTLGVANVFASVQYMEQVEFSYPYDISCSTFLTPPPSVWPQFYTLVKPFDGYLWMATISSLLFGGISIQMVASLYHRLFGLRDRLQLFGNAMMYTTQSLTGIRCGSENNSPWPVRLYNSNWWLFFFLLGTFYRTGLTSWLASSPILMLPIDTISQLVRSDLKLYGFNTFMRDLAQDSNDPDTIELGRRLEIVPANMTVEFLMGQQDTNAFYENKNYLKYLSATVLPSANPWQRLHVMRECLRTFPVAIAMSPGSPFKSEITQIINRLNAAGIIRYWLDSVVYNDNIVMKKHVKGYEPFTLYCLEGVFCLLLLCYTVDVAIFMAEVMLHRISCHSLRRHSVLTAVYDEKK